MQTMVIQGRVAIQRAMKRHAALRKPLTAWMEIAGLGQWRNIIDARAAWPTADAVRGTNLTCFNIGGNNFRLLAIVNYATADIAVEAVLTHAEYNKQYG